jgi:hypothetical protein
MRHHPYAVAATLAKKAVTGSHPGPAYYAALVIAAAAIIAGIYYAIRFAMNHWPSPK